MLKVLSDHSTKLLFPLRFSREFALAVWMLVQVKVAGDENAWNTCSTIIIQRDVQWVRDDRVPLNGEAAVN